MTVNERQVPAYREVGTNEAGGKRRHWPEAVKRELVAATFEPGASVSLVARRHDVNTNLLFKWRRRFAAPKPMAAVASAGLVPVEIVPDPTSAPAAVTTAKPVTGTIEIALAGGVRVRITGAVDPAAVTAAVAAVMTARRRR